MSELLGVEPSVFYPLKGEQMGSEANHDNSSSAFELALASALVEKDVQKLSNILSLLDLSQEQIDRVHNAITQLSEF